MAHPAFCPCQVLEMLDSLNGEWLTFQQILLDSEQMLKKHKEKFKTGLIHAADDFKKKAHNLLEDFEFKGFPHATTPPPLALAVGTQHSEGPGKVKADGGVAWRAGKRGGPWVGSGRGKEATAPAGRDELPQSGGLLAGRVGRKCSYPDFLSSTRVLLCSPDLVTFPLFSPHSPSFPFLSHVRAAVGFAH